MEEERSGRKEGPLLTPTVMLLLLLLPFAASLLAIGDRGRVGEGVDWFERKGERNGKKKKKDATLAEYDDIWVLGNSAPFYSICPLIQATLFPNPILPRISVFIDYYLVSSVPTSPRHMMHILLRTTLPKSNPTQPHPITSSYPTKSSQLQCAPVHKVFLLRYDRMTTTGKDLQARQPAMTRMGESIRYSRFWMVHGSTQQAEMGERSEKTNERPGQREPAIICGPARSYKLRRAQPAPAATRYGRECTLGFEHSHPSGCGRGMPCARARSGRVRLDRRFGVCWLRMTPSSRLLACLSLH